MNEWNKFNVGDKIYRAKCDLYYDVEDWKFDTRTLELDVVEITLTDVVRDENGDVYYVRGTYIDSENQEHIVRIPNSYYLDELEAGEDHDEDCTWKEYRYLVFSSSKETAKSTLMAALQRRLNNLVTTKEALSSKLIKFTEKE